MRHSSIAEIRDLLNTTRDILNKAGFGELPRGVGLSPAAMPPRGAMPEAETLPAKPSAAPYLPALQPRMTPAARTPTGYAITPGERPWEGKMPEGPLPIGNEDLEAQKESLRELFSRKDPGKVSTGELPLIPGKFAKPEYVPSDTPEDKAKMAETVSSYDKPLGSLQAAGGVAENVFNPDAPEKVFSASSYRPTESVAGIGGTTGKPGATGISSAVGAGESAGGASSGKMTVAPGSGPSYGYSEMPISTNPFESIPPEARGGVPTSDADNPTSSKAGVRGASTGGFEVTPGSLGISGANLTPSSPIPSLQSTPQGSSRVTPTSLSGFGSRASSGVSSEEKTPALGTPTPSFGTGGSPVPSTPALSTPASSTPAISKPIAAPVGSGQESSTSAAAKSFFEGNEMNKGLLIGPGMGFGGFGSGPREDDLQEYRGSSFEAKAYELHAKQCRIKADLQDIPCCIWDPKKKDPNESKRRTLHDKLTKVRGEWLRLHADLLEENAKELREGDTTQKSTSAVIEKCFGENRFRNEMEFFRGTSFHAQALECMAKKEEIKAKMSELPSYSFTSGVMMDPAQKKREVLEKKRNECDAELFRLKAKVLKEQAKEYRKNDKMQKSGGPPNSSRHPQTVGIKKEVTPMRAYQQCRPRTDSRFSGDEGTSFDLQFFHKAQRFEELINKVFA